jgi:hypothetical protein
MFFKNRQRMSLQRAPAMAATNSKQGHSKHKITALCLMCFVFLIRQTGFLWTKIFFITKETSHLASNATAAVSSSGDICPRGSTLAKPIILDFAKIKSSDIDRLRQVKGFTAEEYEKYITAPVGTEHYALLHYLSKNYADPELVTSCKRRHLVDIGTRYVASSLSMASDLHPPPKVMTFDIPNSKERLVAFRGKTEQEWQGSVRAYNVDIQFNNVDLLQVSDEDFEKYMNTWLIVLDTLHQPNSAPFEREWLKRLVDAKFFKGVIVLDDLNLNLEMMNWWMEVKDNAAGNGYVAYDITKVGHFSGTGLLDFSGQVSVIDNI